MNIFSHYDQNIKNKLPNFEINNKNSICDPELLSENQTINRNLLYKIHSIRIFKYNESNLVYYIALI